jgi:hypothetical protein
VIVRTPTQRTVLEFDGAKCELRVARSATGYRNELLVGPEAQAEFASLLTSARTWPAHGAVTLDAYGQH